MRHPRADVREPVLRLDDRHPGRRRARLPRAEEDKASAAGQHIVRGVERVDRVLGGVEQRLELTDLERLARSDLRGDEVIPVVEVEQLPAVG